MSLGTVCLTKIRRIWIRKCGCFCCMGNASCVTQFLGKFGRLDASWDTCCMFTPLSFTPLEDRVSVSTVGPWRWGEGTSTCIRRGKKRKEVHLAPQCVSHTSVQTGCGRIEGVSWGRVSSTPLFLLSCPRPHGRSRNRPLCCPALARRFASYITTALSWGWPAQLARALIRTVGLRWPPCRTAGGSLSRIVRVGWGVMMNVMMNGFIFVNGRKLIPFHSKREKLSFDPQ